MARFCQNISLVKKLAYYFQKAWIIADLTLLFTIQDLVSGMEIFCLAGADESDLARQRRARGARFRAAPHAIRIAGAGWPSISTFTQAGLPEAKARSTAGPISSARVTNSPCPPSAATTRS